VGLVVGGELMGMVGGGGRWWCVVLVLRGVGIGGGGGCEFWFWDEETAFCQRGWQVEY